MCVGVKAGKLRRIDMAGDNDINATTARVFDLGSKLLHA